MSTDIKRNIFVNITAVGNPIVVTVTDETQLQSLSFAMSLQDCRHLVEALEDALEMAGTAAPAPAPAP